MGAFANIQHRHYTDLTTDRFEDRKRLPTLANRAIQQSFQNGHFLKREIIGAAMIEGSALTHYRNAEWGGPK